MSKRTDRLVALAFSAILGGAGAGRAQEATASPRASGYHIFLTGKARMAVDDALQGAARRLESPTCRYLFDDFVDGTGRALAATLTAQNTSATDFLSTLYFVEADDTAQCRNDGVVGAFTAPGSRVIHVCGTRFAQFAAKPKGGEILLIHELLHALGLGENPPTSAQITDAVMNRCGK
jgi:hypothetical protein